MQCTICGERAARAGLDLFLRRLPSPLAQKASVAVEHNHATVPISIGDVDIAVRGIDDHAGGVEELRAARVEALPFGRAVGRVEDAALADLQKGLSVVAPFLDDAVAVAGEPDVVLVIDEAAVDDARDRSRVAE